MFFGKNKCIFEKSGLTKISQDKIRGKADRKEAEPPGLFLKKENRKIMSNL